MPLEIREIGISMRVGEEAPPAESPAQVEEAAASRQEIVDDCVRRVLALLKMRQER